MEQSFTLYGHLYKCTCGSALFLQTTDPEVVACKGCGKLHMKPTETFTTNTTSDKKLPWEK